MQSKYKVSLYTCHAALPFFFATHPWFVIENNGQIERWGVGFQRYNRPGLSWGHLNKDARPPYQGITIFPYINKFFWKSCHQATIEGDENSTAQKMMKFIANSLINYPYRDNYSLLGPNSNTYVQWVLNKFPESGLSLPWNAFGKNYHD